MCVHHLVRVDRGSRDDPLPPAVTFHLAAEGFNDVSANTEGIVSLCSSFCFVCFVLLSFPPFFLVANEYFLILHFNLCVCHLEKSVHAGKKKKKKQNKKQKPIHEITFVLTFRKEQPCLFYYIIKHDLLVYVGLHI